MRRRSPRPSRAPAVPNRRKPGAARDNSPDVLPFADVPAGRDGPGLRRSAVRRSPPDVTHTVRLIPAAVATLVLVAAGSGASSDTGSALPSRLEAYFGDQVMLSARQRARLDSGSPVATMLDGDASKDVGVFGAVWIAAPRDRYDALMNDIDTFEQGSRHIGRAS